MDVNSWVEICKIIIKISDIINKHELISINICIVKTENVISESSTFETVYNESHIPSPGG